MLLPPLVLGPPVLSPVVSLRAPAVDLRVVSAVVRMSLVVPRPLVPPHPVVLSPAVASAMVIMVTMATMATVVRAVSPLEALSPLVASVALVRVVKVALLLLLPPPALSVALAARSLASSLSPVLSLLAQLSLSPVAPPWATSSSSVSTPVRSARSKFISWVITPFRISPLLRVK